MFCFKQTIFCLMFAKYGHVLSDVRSRLDEIISRT